MLRISEMQDWDCLVSSSHVGKLSKALLARDMPGEEQQLHRPGDSPRILRTGDPSSNSTPDQLTGLHKDPALHFASAAEHNQGLAGTLRDRDHTGLGADMGLDRRGTVPVADCSIPSADPAGSILVAAPAADSSSVAARKVHREDNSPAAGPGRMDQAIRFRRSA